MIRNSKLNKRPVGAEFNLNNLKILEYKFLSKNKYLKKNKLKFVNLEDGKRLRTVKGSFKVRNIDIKGYAPEVYLLDLNNVPRIKELDIHNKTRDIKIGR